MGNVVNSCGDCGDGVRSWWWWGGVDWDSGDGVRVIFIFSWWWWL